MRTIAETIAQELGKQIIRGEFAAGTKLRGELTGSFHHQVSRQAYREAILILASKGLIEQRPRSGTIVCDRCRWNYFDPDVLFWTFETEEEARKLTGLFELRVIVEPEAAALAAQRRSPEHIIAMRSAIQEMYQWPLSSPKGQAADAAFHQLIFEAAQNDFMQSLSVGIATAVKWVNILKDGVVAPRKECIDEHAAVLDAIEAQDSDKARRLSKVIVDHPLPALLQLRALKAKRDKAVQSHAAKM